MAIGKCDVSKKDLMRIVGLIGWLGTPATGHVPFFGGRLLCALLGSMRLAQGLTPPLDFVAVGSPGCHSPLFCAP